MMPATTISVGARPAVFRGRGTWLSGASASARPVALRLDDQAGALVIGGSLHWPYDDIRRLPDQAGDDRITLRSAGDRIGRLVLHAPDDLRIIRTRARRIDRAAPPSRRPSLILAWAVAALASVAVIMFVLVPYLADRLAPLLPEAGERALGEATYEQVRRVLGPEYGVPLEVCDTSEGTAALAEMTGTLTAGTDLGARVEVSVLDHELVNAFALPGGRVVIFRGMLEAAEAPEELAAVIAHEIGHVAAGDPTRIALRSAGSIGVLGLVLGDFAGGTVVLFLTNRLIQADYTRAAEAAADSFAHARLREAGLPPSAIASLFERLRETGGEPTALERHFLSHPEIGDRIAAARAATPEGQQVRPALTPAGWAALTSICDD